MQFCDKKYFDSFFLLKSPKSRFYKFEKIISNKKTPNFIIIYEFMNYI